MRKRKRKEWRLEKRGGGSDSGSNSNAEQPSIFDSGGGDANPPPGVNVFTHVKVASASVRQEVAVWNNKSSIQILVLQKPIFRGKWS